MGKSLALAGTQKVSGKLGRAGDGLPGWPGQKQGPRACPVGLLLPSDFTSAGPDTATLPNGNSLPHPPRASSSVSLPSPGSALAVPSPLYLCLPHSARQGQAGACNTAVEAGLGWPRIWGVRGGGGGGHTILGLLQRGMKRSKEGRVQDLWRVQNPGILAPSSRPHTQEPPLWNLTG